MIGILLQNSASMLYISSMADYDPKCSCRLKSSYKKELYTGQENIFNSTIYICGMFVIDHHLIDFILLA